MPPESMKVLKRFLETEDLKLLSRPLSFSKRESEYANWLFCQSLVLSVPNAGIPCLICPIGMCCTSKLVPHVDMQLDDHAVRVNEASNDFCCHIKTEKKTVPLDKVQDVQVEQGCAESCCGVKILSILTGGEGNQTAAFLDAPDEVRSAIMLAVRLAKSTPPAAVNSMSDTGSGTMALRLKNVHQLKERGVLTEGEANSIRVQVLAADKDPTKALLEAADLRDSKAISGEEFQGLKSVLLARLRL